MCVGGLLKWSVVCDIVDDLLCYLPQLTCRSKGASQSKRAMSCVVVWLGKLGAFSRTFGS